MVEGLTLADINEAANRSGRIQVTPEIMLTYRFEVVYNTVKSEGTGSVIWNSRKGIH